MIQIRAIRLGGIVAAAAIAVATAPLSQALAAAGATTLVLDGPAAKSLRAQGVRIRPLQPAGGGAKRIALPLEGGLAGSTTTLLHHRGGISLSRGERKLRLVDLSLVLGKHSRVTAELGGKGVGLFQVLDGGERSIDPVAGTVKLDGLRLKLTPAAAGTIARRLALERLRPRRFGSLSASASGLATGGGQPSPDTPAQKSTGCPLPSGAGAAAEGPPPVPVRPPGAADVTSATIDWQVRESFIRYIATGEGTSVLDGANADPPLLLPGASAPLSYTFHFPFAGGWRDAGANPSDPADDSAEIDFSGAVRFHYSAHGIDLVAANPEIEIAGPSSRAIFAISDSGGAPERQVLVNLDLSRATAIRASGNAFTYERVPGAIPAGTAASVFAGFYTPGTDFGCFTVSFSTGS